MRLDDIVWVAVKGRGNDIATATFMNGRGSVLKHRDCTYSIWYGDGTEEIWRPKLDSMTAQCVLHEITAISERAEYYTTAYTNENCYSKK